MIRSMTGFGEAEKDTPAGRLRLEVKTVNHRFFNPNVKTPPGFDRFERDVTEALRAHIARGHVSAYLSLDRSAGNDAATPARLDLEKARQYRDALEAMRAELAIPGTVDLGMLARFGDVFRTPENDKVPEIDPETVRALAEEAARGVVALREAEGARLHEDLAGRLDAMAAQISVVETRAPERLVRERDRLREAVRELAAQVEVDEDRLAREVAYLAERWDVNEELVRFRAHVAAFREALESDGPEAVGKRLGFLVQEMHREVNTIGSKANDALIAQASVALKEEIERLREQVENVE
jgi:uncharacterized protein (TIGR00255 family)